MCLAWAFKFAPRRIPGNNILEGEDTMKMKLFSALTAAVMYCTFGFVATAPSAASAQSPTEVEEITKKVAALGWYKVGQTGDIAGKATFLVTGRHTFLNPSDTDKFLQINGNPPTGGKSNTLAATQSDWFAILTFSPEGYVKDDEKIDNDALLATLKENNKRQAEERRKNGYPVLTMLGWAIPPRYDTQNKRLEWGTLLRDESSQAIYANVNTKILGRSGFTDVILVSESPETVEKDLADFKVAMANFSYVSGEKYSDWKQGDKVAAYGLGALVLGGAAAVATSKGGLKALGIAILAGLAALWGVIRRFFGKKKAGPTA